jgi:hypothetical protein
MHDLGLRPQVRSLKGCTNDSNAHKFKRDVWITYTTVAFNFTRRVKPLKAYRNSSIKPLKARLSSCSI